MRGYPVALRWTIDEAVEQLDPPIPRRTLADLMKHVEPCGMARGGRGRPAMKYPVETFAIIHRDYVDRMLQRAQ
jgi:hypothetical protein